MRIRHFQSGRTSRRTRSARGDRPEPLVLVELGGGAALHPAESRPLGAVVPESGADARDGSAGGPRGRAKDESFVANVERVYRSFQEYRKRASWFQEVHGADAGARVAYFSCEYGIDEGLPIYSGGLGVLSGDHLKSASDLGIPLVGVGLLYQKGYFRQVLSLDGWQKELYRTTTGTTCR